MKRYIFLLLISIATISSYGGMPKESVRKIKTHKEKSYIYRFTLRDKQGTPFSTDRPREFLSRKAVERRKRQNLAIDSTDLPVSPHYINMLTTPSTKVIGTSRWQNTVLLLTADTSAVNTLRLLDGVTGCTPVWQSPDSIEQKAKSYTFHESTGGGDSTQTSRYGATEEQTAAVGGMALHKAGFTGKGMTIAVLDGGFRNADRIPAISSIKTAGTRDFVYPPSHNIYSETDHGTKVLSVMGAAVPHVYMGTAPDATYWLLRCEDTGTEQPVEEDFWTMAAEFADSVGADVINSSVGYNQYDRHHGDHRYCEMDGRTALISRSASMLADKGIILVCSAGNSGMGPWKKIVFPADATDIITVGALTPQLTNAPFSGIGPTQDGRVKPDVMAPGCPAIVISGRGTVMPDMGTSFASPLVCGLVACLWQAMPDKTAREIIEMVRRGSDNYTTPDNIFGYGIPNFGKIYTDCRQPSSTVR